MKALILAAGLGTRLRPLTNSTPKPLLKIKNKPLLEYHIEQLFNHGVTGILINTHYLSEQIEDFVHKINSESVYENLEIKTSFEVQLLGSAGTLASCKSFFEGEDNFIVVYGDNLTDINYTKMLNFHLKNKGVATIACYYENFPETKGIICFDENNRINKFVEKPKKEEIVSNFANGGIYIFNKRIFDLLDTFKNAPLDFGYDVFPKMLHENQDMFVYKMSEFLLDIGTIESYNKSQLVSLNFKNERK